MITKALLPLLAALLLALLPARPLAAQPPVNINTADASELTVLSGVGPVRAEAIVAYRRQNGPFVAVDELGKVRGIGQKTVDANRDRLTVGGDTLSSFAP